MKKSIFSLTYKEGKELDKKMRKTSYYKQYLKVFLLEIVLFDLFVGFFIGWTSEGIEEKVGSVASEIFSTSAIIVVLGFVAISAMLFGFKRFDLIKQYYEDTKEKNKEN